MRRKPIPIGGFSRSGVCVAALAAVLFLCGGARGQSQDSGKPAAAQATTPSPEAPAETAAQKPGGAPASTTAPAPKPLMLGPVTVSGTLRVRSMDWNWFAGDAENTYGYVDSILRVRLSQQKARWGWQIELAQPTMLGLPDNAIAPGAQGALGLGGNYYAANSNQRNVWGLFVSKALLNFKGFGGKESNSLLLGRMEFNDGAEVTPKDKTLAALKQMRISQRLIGNFGWSVVGRNDDGFSLSLNPGKTNITLAAARTARGVYQMDGWGSLDLGFAYGALTVPVGSAKSSGELRVFAIGYYDARALAKVDNRTASARNGADRSANLEIGTYGAHYIHVFNTENLGKWDLLFWGVLQNGAWGLQSQRSWAMAEEVGWQPNEPRLKPWLRLGYSYGSGDSNPNDGTHGTFFQLLPTPRWYARDPFYNMENLGNLAAIVILRPSPKLTLRTEGHALRLANPRDLWYQGGGAFQPHTFGYTGRPSYGNHGLANYWDISADYTINPHWGVGFYFGNIWGKGVLNSLYPRNPNSQFGYSELDYRF